MMWHDLMRDGVKLSGFDGGTGPPVVFQHGLGGDEAQVAEVFPQSGFRRLTLECRGHGKSQTGDSKDFSIAAFTDDVLAFARQRGLVRFAVGGVSMGAAIALRIAVQHPERVTALVLARPAWVWARAPRNMQAFAELAAFLPEGRREDFDASPTAQHLATVAPDNLASLRKFFDRADPRTAARLLAAVAADGPGITEQDIRAIAIPTLVIGNTIDWIHPLSNAQTLAALIPGARFVEIAPKAIDKTRHFAEFRAAVSAFLLAEGS